MVYIEYQICTLINVLFFDKIGVLKRTISIVVVVLLLLLLISLTSESVQGAALTFQSVDDVHGGDSLALGVFSVGDSVPDDIF